MNIFFETEQCPNECLTLGEAHTFLPQMVYAQHTGNGSKIISAITFILQWVEIFRHN